MEQYFEDRITVDYDVFNEKSTVISVSLFTCNNAYNKFDMYIEGLRILVEKFKTYQHWIKFLVFHDLDLSTPSGKRLLELCDDYRDIHLARFDFPEFKQGDYHIGMFGTLIRYLPMFLTKFKYRYLYIIDCDVVGDRVPQFRVYTLKNFIKTGDNLHFLTIPSAPLNPRYAGMQINLKTWMRIIGEGMILKGIKFPVEILYNFLHIYICSETYQNQCDIIFTENIKYEYKLKPEHGKFMYGVDEFMLVFLMQYVEDNNIPFRYTLCPYHYKLPFYYWLENEATEESKLKLKTLLGMDLMDFVKSYPYRDRGKMFKDLLAKIDANEFFSPMIRDCIIREYTYLTYTYSLKY